MTTPGQTNFLVVGEWKDCLATDQDHLPLTSLCCQIRRVWTALLPEVWILMCVDLFWEHDDDQSDDDVYGRPPRMQQKQGSHVARNACLVWTVWSGAWNESRLVRAPCSGSIWINIAG